MGTKSSSQSPSGLVSAGRGEILRSERHESATVDELTTYTDLPSGNGRGAATVSREYIAVRVQGPSGDRLCVAHRPWMSLDEARRMAAAVFELASEGGQHG
jgi:hypothetical protein